MHRKIEAAHITQIFQTTVYDGGSATVVGSAPNSSINTTIVRNDFESLREALEHQGISAEDLRELRTAISEDDKPTAKDKFGPKVSSWIGKMVKKAAEGTWNAGVTIAGKIASDAVMKYYGLS